MNTNAFILKKHKNSTCKTKLQDNKSYLEVCILLEHYPTPDQFLLHQINLTVPYV